MKFGYWILFSLCILISSVSCKKDNATDNPIAGSNSIIGSWEIRETAGGMAAGSTKYPPGNGIILHLDGSNYEVRANGNITRRGQYSILPDSTVSTSVCLEIPKGQFTNRIVYDNDTTSVKVFFQVNGNQLEFLSGCYALDGGQMSEYARVGN